MNVDDMLEALITRVALGEPLICGLPRGLTIADVEPIVTSAWSRNGCATWQPRAVELTREALGPVYALVEGPLPPLYERLIRAYEFAQTELMSFRLLGNYPPAPEGLVKSVKDDAVMFNVLSLNRLFQFGRASSPDYDPLCFDMSSRNVDGDCPVVRFDHEVILCDERLGSPTVVAGSFRELVECELMIPLPPSLDRDD